MMRVFVMASPGIRPALAGGVLVAWAAAFVALGDHGSAQAPDRGRPSSIESTRAFSAAPQPWSGGQSTTMPALSAQQSAAIRASAAGMNRPDSRIALTSTRVAPPQGAQSFPTDVGASAPGTFAFTVRDFTDAETANATSAIASSSVALSESRALFTGNWFLASSINGGTVWYYVDPANTLPAIPNQSFCCNSSLLYDRSRGMFIWVALWVNAAHTASTIRIAVTSDFSSGYLYQFTSGSFGKAGLADYPQVALGANHLYITMNHFNPGFTGSTVARLPLTEMRRSAALPFDYVNRGEFTLRMAHDSGPGTRAYLATHVDNATLRVFRWEEAATTLQTNDVTIPAWTRGTSGTFTCTSPDGNNPCSRMDDRVLAGFVTGGNNLPASSAQRVVGFSWNARQGGGFPYPYTNVVRLDADTLTLIDNPAIWNAGYALVYADFAPNDRGDLGGVLNQIGPANHPTFLATMLDRDWGVPPDWPMYTLRAGNDSPTDDTWGDYNSVRRSNINGYQWIAAGHTMQGGGTNSAVVPLFVKFWKKRDGF